MIVARLRSFFSFPTPIGRVLRSASGPRFLAAAVAVVALAIDAWRVDSDAGYPWRAVLAVIATLLMWLLCRRDRLSLGLSFRTVQGAAWWWKVTLVTAGVMGAILFALIGILALTDNFHPIRLHPSKFIEQVVHACLWAPFVEEVLYRLVLVVALASVLRSGWVILVAGMVFAGLHVLYGNPAPANAIGGFCMTWAYLKSGSLVVPLLWHSAGNLFLLGTQVVAYVVF